MKELMAERGDLSGKRHKFRTNQTPARSCERTLNRQQVRSRRGVHLLFDRIKTVSKGHLNEPLGLSVERRADSPGYWKD
jgi:hypothetical protein